MRLLIDLTDALSDWQELLEDLGCTGEDLEDSIFHYTPRANRLTPESDDLMDNPALSDDVLHYLSLSMNNVMSDKIEEYMTLLGYTVSEVIQVIVSHLGGGVLAIIHATPLRLGDQPSAHCSGSLSCVQGLVNVSRQPNRDAARRRSFHPAV